MPQLGKITGFDLLRGPTGFNLALGDGCEDCCCNCFGAAQPYVGDNPFRCVTADFSSTIITKTTATFTISGTPVFIPFSSGPCGGGAATFPDPSGSYVLTLPTTLFGVGRVRYRNIMIACQNAANWYVVDFCMVLSVGAFQCAEGSTVASLAYTTRGSIVPKSGPAPTTTAGWVNQGNNTCNIGGGEASYGSIEMKSGLAGHNVYRYQLGPHAGGNCGTSCNEIQCFPKCFTNAVFKQRSDTNTGNGGVNISGMSLAVAFT